MRLKDSFRRELIRLYKEIGLVLENDIHGKAEQSYSFIPFLYQMYSRFWQHSYRDF